MAGPFACLFLLLRVGSGALNVYFHAVMLPCRHACMQLKEITGAVDKAATDPSRFNLTNEELSNRRRWIDNTGQQVSGAIHPRIAHPSPFSTCTRPAATLSPPNPHSGTASAPRCPCRPATHCVSLRHTQAIVPLQVTAPPPPDEAVAGSVGGGGLFSVGNLNFPFLCVRARPSPPCRSIPCTRRCRGQSPRRPRHRAAGRGNGEAWAAVAGAGKERRCGRSTRGSWGQRWNPSH